MKEKREIQKGNRIWRPRAFCILATTLILWIWGDIAQPQATNCQVGTYDCAGQLYLYNSNIGVGTTTPNSKLDVNGLFLVSGVNTPTTGSGVSIYQSSGTGVIDSYNWGAAARNPLQLYGNPLVLQPGSGSVGIGTTSPGAQLDVAVGSVQCCATQVPNISLAQGSNANGQMSWLQFHNAGEAEAYIRLAGGGPAGGPRAGQRRLEIGDSQGVTTGLTVTGNVGIGTTNLNSRLNVSWNANNLGSAAIFGVSTGSAYAGIWGEAQGTTHIGTYGRGNDNVNSAGVQGYAGSFPGSIGVNGGAGSGADSIGVNGVGGFGTNSVGGRFASQGGGYNLKLPARNNDSVGIHIYATTVGCASGEISLAPTNTTGGQKLCVRGY